MNINRYKHNYKREFTSFSKYRDLFELKVIDDITDKCELVKIGKFNFYDKIQDYAPECDINNIVLKAQNGLLAPEDLSMNDSQVGDLTQLKYHNLSELKTAANKAEKLYASLPQELTSNFKNLDDFMSHITQEVFDKFSNDYLSKNKEVSDNA